MPQLLFMMAVGAGVYSAYKWIAGEAEKAADAARRAQEELRRHAEGGGAGNAPKDLGALVWDEKTGAYRPKGGA